VRGDRRRLRALDHLIGAPLSLRELHAAGVRLDPSLAMTVVGLMIEPAWTAAERFTLAHQSPGAPAPDIYLHVRDGKPPLPTAEPPHGPIETILICQDHELLGALAGAAQAVELSGQERSLTLVRQWLDRAQSG
jgi:hypothetical protein